jgi:uncharacterized protein (UPF0262 family)
LSELRTMTLSELRLDDATWSAGSAARKSEWRVAIAEVVQEGRFESPHDGKPSARLTVGRARTTLTLHDGEDRLLSSHELPIGELTSLMDEYMQICAEMGKLNLGGRSPRLEALDIAKRITHDEAGELVRSSLRGLKPDHGTARRLFTLLVTLFHDTTELAAPPHPVRS